MSQVKNLRAMFENKGDKSPPDRGRSPGASSSTALPAGRLGPNDAGSPRPLSKVRTNFVAIEKDGRIGLRMDRSGESSPSRRPMSMDAIVDPTSTSPVKTADEKCARRVLESALAIDLPRQPPNTAPYSEAAGTLSDKPSSNPDKVTDHEQPFADLQPVADLQPAEPPSTVASGILRSRAKTPVPGTGGRQAAKAHTSRSTATSRASTTLSKKTYASGAASARSDGRAAVRADKTANEASKRNDGKPAKKALEKLGANRGDGTRAAKATTTSTPKPRATPSTHDSRPQPVKEPVAGDAGLSKPKSKSPTRPADVPASLMAPTTSSVIKGHTSRELPSRQSGSLHNLNVPSQPPTRAGSSMASTSSQHSRRPGSALSRPRPSVRPPPGKPMQPDTSAAKRQGQVDEGFLARMMRPTQSSSSKTAEKPPTTPPKKTGPRSSTAAIDRSVRDPAGSRKAAATLSRASKKTGSCTSPKSESSRVDKQSTPEPITSQSTDMNAREVPVAIDAHEPESITPLAHAIIEQGCSGAHAGHDGARPEICEAMGEPAQEATLEKRRAESRERGTTPVITTTEAALSEMTEVDVEKVMRTDDLPQSPRSIPTVQPDKPESSLRCHPADEPPLELNGATLPENNGLPSEQLMAESEAPPEDSETLTSTNELPELSMGSSIQRETRATESPSGATNCHKPPPKHVEEMKVYEDNADSSQDFVGNGKLQNQSRDPIHGSQIERESGYSTPKSRQGKDMALHEEVLIEGFESANYKGESMA